MDIPAKQHLPAIVDLLQNSDLPVDDLPTLDLSHFRVVLEEGEVIAVGGIEKCANSALLRSIATATSMQGRGLARAIVDELETLSRERGIENLYLLTESATDYFTRMGYQQCSRESAPDEIQRTQQFSSLCPDSAAFMFKHVGG